VPSAVLKVPVGDHVEPGAGLAAAEQDRAGWRADLCRPGRDAVKLLRRQLAEERHVLEEVLGADGTGSHAAMLRRPRGEDFDLR
jgi:hypothetical protein